MPDFGIMRGFGDKLFGNKLVAGQLPINLGKIGSQSFGFDIDAQAFFDRVTAAGGSLSATEKFAIDTLVKQMKLDGIWSLMKAIYPMVGGSAAACAQNLKSASFTGTFSSGWTFASTGITPNGISSFMDSNLNMFSNLSQNNVHLSYYSRTTTANNAQEVGVNNTAVAAYNPQYGLSVRNFTGNSSSACFGNYNTNVATVTNLASSAYFALGTRTSNILNKLYRNGAAIATNTTTNFEIALNYNFYIGASNGGGTAFQFSNKQCAFASIGDGLTDTQASNFYTAVQAMQVTLNRNV
jgi:hypothetical protein